MATAGETSDQAKVVDSDFEDVSEVQVVYRLRDFNSSMTKAWEEAFEKYVPDRVQISVGDIFNGAPSADAIVSPANSFGFMDGGIDMAYSMHFGWQMQKRLQKVIKEEHNGELLVGNAIIIPSYDKQHLPTEDMSDYNEGKLIKYLISSPTMRVPLDVSETVNAYLAFRAVILAVQKHNRNPDVEKIRTVLCPGLGTAVGSMPKVRCAHQVCCREHVKSLMCSSKDRWANKKLNCFMSRSRDSSIGNMPEVRCAYQMLQAFETFELGLHNERKNPDHLVKMCDDQYDMSEYGKTRDFTKKELERIESLPLPPED